jgi:hypothetical protein
MARKGDIPWNKGLTVESDSRVNYKRTTCFKKGLVPWNKGKKGSIKANSGSFKPGIKPATWVPVGTIKFRKANKGVKRNFIKVAEPKKWEEYPKWLWKKKYGFLIKGDVTHHLDGSKDNDVIENIIALPRKDHPIFHSRWGLHPLSEEQLTYYRGRYEKRIDAAQLPLLEATL